MMVQFYWTSATGTSRVFVNFDLAARWSIGFGKMQFVLDTLCLWGGADKNDKCVDGTHTMSWEFNDKQTLNVHSILEKWKIPNSPYPVWAESPFWSLEAKQPV